MAMNKKIFFRDDDVQDSDSNFKKFIGLFLWHQVPVHLAVIPGEHDRPVWGLFAAMS